MIFPKFTSMPSRDLEQLYPFVKYLFLKLQLECKKKGLNIICTQTVRTGEYQNQLYAQGRTTPGGIVTNCKDGQSPHQFRVAFDICVTINGKATWDVKYYKAVYEISKTIPYLEAGYVFRSFVDPPHYQCLMGLSQADLRAGKIPNFPSVPLLNPPPVVKPTPIPTPQPPLKRIQITVDSVNIRKTYLQNSPILGKAVLNNQYNSTKIVGQFYEIVYKGGLAYISVKCAKVISK